MTQPATLNSTIGRALLPHHLHQVSSSMRGAVQAHLEKQLQLSQQRLPTPAPTVCGSQETWGWGTVLSLLKQLWGSSSSVCVWGGVSAGLSRATLSEQWFPAIFALRPVLPRNFTSTQHWAPGQCGCQRAQISQMCLPGATIATPGPAQEPLRSSPHSPTPGLQYCQPRALCGSQALPVLLGQSSSQARRWPLDVRIFCVLALCCTHCEQLLLFLFFYFWWHLTPQYIFLIFKFSCKSGYFPKLTENCLASVLTQSADGHHIWLIVYRYITKKRNISNHSPNYLTSRPMYVVIARTLSVGEESCMNPVQPPAWLSFNTAKVRARQECTEQATSPSTSWNFKEKSSAEGREEACQEEAVKWWLGYGLPASSSLKRETEIVPMEQKGPEEQKDQVPNLDKALQRQIKWTTLYTCVNIKKSK